MGSELETRSFISLFPAARPGISFFPDQLRRRLPKMPLRIFLLGIVIDIPGSFVYSNMAAGLATITRTNEITSPHGLVFYPCLESSPSSHGLLGIQEEKKKNIFSLSKKTDNCAIILRQTRGV